MLTIKIFIITWITAGLWLLFFLLFPPSLKKTPKPVINQNTKTVTFDIAVHVVELISEKEQICKYRSCDICSVPLLPKCQQIEVVSKCEKIGLQPFMELYSCFCLQYIEYLHGFLPSPGVWVLFKYILQFRSESLEIWKFLPSNVQLH